MFIRAEGDTVPQARSSDDPGRHQPMTKQPLGRSECTWTTPGSSTRQKPALQTTQGSGPETDPPLPTFCDLGQIMWLFHPNVRFHFVTGCPFIFVVFFPFLISMLQLVLTLQVSKQFLSELYLMET